MVHKYLNNEITIFTYRLWRNNNILASCWLSSEEQDCWDVVCKNCNNSHWTHQYKFPYSNDRILAKINNCCLNIYCIELLKDGIVDTATEIFIVIIVAFIIFIQLSKRLMNFKIFHIKILKDLTLRLVLLLISILKRARKSRNVLDKLESLIHYWI